MSRVDEREFMARVAAVKQESVANAMSVSPQAVSGWGKAGVPQERILDYLESLGLGVFDIATEQVMSNERVKALELFAREGLMRGDR